VAKSRALPGRRRRRGWLCLRAAWRADAVHDRGRALMPPAFAVVGPKEQTPDRRRRQSRRTQAARIRRRHLPRVLRDAGPLPHGRRALENLERKDARAPDQDTSARGGRRRKLVARRRRPRPGRRPHHDDLPVAAHAGDLLPLRAAAHEGSSGVAEAHILWAKDFAMSPSISLLLLAALVGGA